MEQSEYYQYSNKIISVQTLISSNVQHIINKVKVFLFTMVPSVQHSHIKTTTVFYIRGHKILQKYIA